MNIQLHYTEKGTGTPLILLHGNGEDSSYFVHQIEYFSASYRVIAVDTRGHGASPRGDAPFSIPQFAEDLKSFMDRLNIEKAHILGFSDGGNIALTFALKYPERVDKLILNGANLNPKGVKASVQIPVVIGYYISKILGGKKKAELLGLMVNEPNFTPEDLKKLQIPTFVIAGKKDMIKDSHTRLIADSIKGAQLAIIEGDHFIANKNAAEFNSSVGNFLDN
ncbi:MAG: alpha/beta hydrolase [Oscillospiraceae bacterium]|nr:alpha/beta hydrolase [Oscillospiraceae bacterium]